MEFVQSLGNPNYLHFLAQRGYMKDPCFVNYLKYLQYWQEPQYVKWVGFEALIKDFSTTYLRIYNCRYLKYPVCLHFLELLQHETFRREIVRYEKSRTVLWVYCYTQCFCGSAYSSGSGFLMLIPIRIRILPPVLHVLDIRIFFTVIHSSARLFGLSFSSASYCRCHKFSIFWTDKLYYFLGK